MKIIYIANSRIPTEKAHGVQIMKMCEAFSMKGHEIVLVVPRRLNHIKDDPFDYYGVKKNFKIVKLPTIDLIEFGKIGFLIQSFSFTFFLLVYLIFTKTDILYSRDFLPLYYASFIKKPVFWEIHIAYWNGYVQRLLPRCKGLIPITHGIKNFYLEKGFQDKNFHVSSDAVDLKQFSFAETPSEFRKKFLIPCNKKVISYIGKYKTMDLSKGVEELIDAFSILVKTTPDIFLLLVGMNKSEFEEVNERIVSKGIAQDNYKIVLHVPQKEVSQYLILSDILIMNYPRLDHYVHYMSSLKLFEYMASGVPIISSDLPSIREILTEKTAFFVQPGDSEDLLAALTYVLGHPVEAKQKAQQALVEVKNYTWDNRAQGIIKYIEK